MNYKTLAADIGWVEALIKIGEIRRAGLPTSVAAIQRGLEITKLDPNYYSVYLWIPAAYLSRKHLVSEESLKLISELMDVGIDHFPNDPELPFSAAMNYIGQSDLNDKPRRVREIRRSLEYLNIAAARPGAWEDMPALIGALAKRLRDLESETGVDESVFLEEMIFRLGRDRAPDLWESLPADAKVRLSMVEPVALVECVGYLSRSLCEAVQD
ncbi:hypothetical protein FRD01_21345 [Microvenator marinus]|uniref:Uncharacterized protein n=1 Tax=Microvenator marinus TaxID=2600177 RepID=A0A5B8XUV8_9DELT|nr:hypothetical protein [Microvenator marinus]QED29732.1 hypothetical protein FRD01_21345 [Microvenator marinus]